MAMSCGVLVKLVLQLNKLPRILSKDGIDILPYKSLALLFLDATVVQNYRRERFSPMSTLDTFYGASDKFLRCAGLKLFGSKTC